MPIFGKFKNIFSAGGDSVKKTKEYSIIQQNVDPAACWNIIEEIGDGAFGKVYKTRHKTQHNLAALKQVPIVEDTDLEDFSVEIEILSQFKHKNVVGLYEAYLYDSKLWIYIEFCAGGALDSIMIDLERPLTEPQIKYVCREMCEGLNFLHEQGVIHRDLKAGNVLLTHNGVVKIADFGVSAKSSGLRNIHSTFIGSPYWMAPEVILCETARDSPYNFKADIWSLGVTLIEFAQMHPPNNEMNPMRVLVKIQKSDPPSLRSPSKWSPGFNSFIEKCLVKNPDQRPTAGELLQHVFIKDLPERKPIDALLSEINAEVIVETNEIEEDDVLSSDHSSETSGISRSPSSNSLQVNETKPSPSQTIGVSGLSSQQKPVAVTAPSTPIVSPKEVTASNNLDKDPPVRAPSSQITAITSRPSNFSDTSLQLEPSEKAKLTSTTEKVSSKPSGPPTAAKPAALINADTSQASPSMSIKRPAVEELPRPSDDSAANQDVKKRYKTMTKTRKFVVDGEERITQSSKVIAIEDEVLKQEEVNFWKQVLNEMKLIQKRDNRVLQNLETQLKFSREEQDKKFKQDVDAAILHRDSAVEELSYNHQSKLEKLNASYMAESRDMEKKVTGKQEQELKEFLKKLQNEVKLAKKELGSLSKEQQRQITEQKEIENMEKERKFIERQKEYAHEMLEKLSLEHRKKQEPLEREFLSQKHSVFEAFENTAWTMEEQYLKQKYDMLKKHLKDMFKLKTDLMKDHHIKENEYIKRVSNGRVVSMQQRQQEEVKQTIRKFRIDQKMRSQQSKVSLRLTSSSGFSSAEQEIIQKLELTHKRQLAELVERNELNLKELELSQAEKLKTLIDDELRRQSDLFIQHQAELAKLKEKVAIKIKGVEDDFQRQLAEHSNFYNINYQSIDLSIASPMRNTQRS